MFSPLLVRTTLIVISVDDDGAERVQEIEQTIRECRVIERFKRIPDTLIESQQKRVPSHEIIHAYDDSIETNDLGLFWSRILTKQSVLSLSSNSSTTQ